MIDHPQTSKLGLRRHSRTLSAVSAVVITLLFTLSLPVFAQIGQPEIILPPIAEVVCQSYIVYDRTKGTAIISQKPDLKIYPASMTKIMTAALTLQYLKNDQVLTVSQAAIDATTPNSTRMGLVVGEEIPVSELLYGLILPSGNDAANVLAEAIVTAAGYTGLTATSQSTAAADSVPVIARSKLDLFSDLMNQKVSELGLVNTHFVNANGLHNDNHYTTASDLAKIFDFALSYDDFRAVISSPTHVFKATNKHIFDAWYVAKNTNCLLTDPWLLGVDTVVAKVVGGKTGTTIPAGTGMTLLSVNKNGDELISVICGIPYSDANRLTSYMAAILNAGAKSCYEADPVVRVEGNVMNNKPFNATANFGPSITAASTPTTAPTLIPTASSQEEPTTTITPPAVSDNNKSDSFPMNFINAHPIISLSIGVFLFIVLLLVIVYFAVNRKSKRGQNGIRRI